MTRANTITPPLLPILKGLRTRADLVDISVQYTPEGTLMGEVAFINSSNGSRGRLSKRQVVPILSFVERNGLLPLVAELSKFGTAVRY